MKEAAPGTAEHRATHPTSGEQGWTGRAARFAVLQRCACCALGATGCGQHASAVCQPVPAAGTGMTGTATHHTSTTGTSTATDRPAL